MLIPFYRRKVLFLRSCSVQRERRTRTPNLPSPTQVPRSPLERARDPRLFFSWTSVSDPVGSTHKNVPAPGGPYAGDRASRGELIPQRHLTTYPSILSVPSGSSPRIRTRQGSSPSTGAPGPGFLPTSRGGSPLLGPFSETVSAPLLASSAPGPLDGSPRNFPRNAAEGSRVPAAGSVGAQDARLQGSPPGRPGPRNENPAVSESRSSGPADAEQSAVTRRRERRPKYYSRKNEG